MTEEELTAAFENGTLSAEEQQRFLDGEDLSGDKTDASPAPATDEEADKVIVETVVPEKEPVVLAKDGVHTLPFSVVEELRESNATLKQAFEEQKGLIEALTKAQVVDAKAGNTEATDDVLTLFEEEFPGLKASFQKHFIDPLKADIEPIKAERAVKVQQDEVASERAAFDKSIADLEPTYMEVKDTTEFWDWFNVQSPLIRAAQTSNDPAVIAEVVKTYNSQKTPAIDKAGDVAAKVKEAIDKASIRSTVQTLSDIPGGTSPATDIVEAFSRMSPSAQEAYMLKLSEPERNKLLNRLV